MADLLGILDAAPPGGITGAARPAIGRVWHLGGGGCSDHLHIQPSVAYAASSTCYRGRQRIRTRSKDGVDSGCLVPGFHPSFFLSMEIAPRPGERTGIGRVTATPSSAQGGYRTHVLASYM